MIEPADTLRTYRQQLHAAIERDLARGRLRARLKRRALALSVPATAALATATVVLLSASAAAGPTLADAAIVRHVRAELTAPAGSIVHQKAMISLDGGPAQLFELWEQTSAPYSYRVIKWGHEGTGTSPGGGPNDPAAMFSSLIRSGNATVDETTTYAGVPAYKLTITGAADPWVNGTAYVAISDYRPLEIDSHGEQIVYQVYEYLPATSADEALVTASGS
jgi:hypothetical protein